MRTNRISVGVLTLIIVTGVSQQATAVEQTMTPFAELDIDAGLKTLPITGEVGAMLGSTGCDTIGGFDRGPHGGPNRWRADIIEMTDDSVLKRIEIELIFFGLADLYFTVHEQCNINDPYERIGPENIVQHQGNEDDDFTLRTYSSKVYDVAVNPVLLKAGCRYLFGVAWAVEVFFVLDERTYPTTDDGFQDGDVLGSSGLTLGGGPPVADTISNLLNIASSGAYLMNICLAPKPGACCQNEGACQDLVLADCQAAGGTFTAERFLCDDLFADEDQDGCPLVAGGCCLPDGACLDLDRFACESEANAGTWNTEACDPEGFLCAPHGACCHEDASCDDFAEGECDNAGDTYQGDDTNCAEDGLACNFGACCAGETCLVLSEPACAGILAIWQGSGSACDDSTCDPPGACCFGETCEDGGDGMNLARCDAAGGVYQGNFSTCDTLTASCGHGACCTSLLGCVDDLSPNVCTNTLGGEFRGVRTTCATLDPLCDTGICCWRGFCLPDTAPRECEALGGGVFVGDGGSCPTAGPVEPQPP
ncbi:MAG: hypothetical protein IH897_03180, partial [Planctomycetes bacterium]|nr:hypothetical protein [Planctomycetota bacterium]